MSHFTIDGYLEHGNLGWRINWIEIREHERFTEDECYDPDEYEVVEFIEPSDVAGYRVADAILSTLSNANTDDVTQSELFEAPAAT